MKLLLQHANHVLLGHGFVSVLLLKVTSSENVYCYL